MRLLDDRLIAVLAVGLLSSMVLLSSSSLPPSVTVPELWSLGEDAALTVSGILVSLRSFESGSEVIVISGESGPPTVKVVCVPGPGPSPSTVLSIGDLVSVSGECVFEDGTPSVFCQYNDVRLLLPSEDVLTVGLLSTSWHLFEGDRISIKGVCEPGTSGAFRLVDLESGCSILMRLDSGLEPIEGAVVVDCVLVLHVTTMSLVLEVSALAPAS